MPPLQRDRIWAGRTLPTISRPNDIVQAIKIWEKNARQAITRPPILKPPRNFMATGQRGGILLEWRADKEASGYEILRSKNGDFSEENNADIVFITVDGGQFSSFFDGISGSGVITETRWYRIRSISGVNETTRGGTALSGKLIHGALSGVVSTTSIDPGDTVTDSTPVRDDFNSDPIAAERQRYRSF